MDVSADDPCRRAAASSLDDALLGDTPPGVWVSDVLDGCSRRTLPLADDGAGPAAATLVRLDEEPGRAPGSRHDAAAVPAAPVLHVHGWSDYFYNLPLARRLSAAGRRFYALDLRRYGRSLRPWQTPGYIDDLARYDEELDAALTIIAEENPGAPAPVIHAHSTGGLVVALWSHRHPGRASALVLNSPWLEMPGDAPARTAVEALAAPLTRLDPDRPLSLPRLDHYWRSLSVEARGEWRLHPRWRPRKSFPMAPGWMRAVVAGHRAVAAGLDITVPVLVLLSEKTRYQRRWSEELTTSDAVLDVEVLARRAVRLGPQVTVTRIEGALHDVFASRAPVRRTALDAMLRWLSAYGPEAPAPAAPPEDADVP